MGLGFSENRLVYVALAVLFLYLLPFFVLGEAAPVLLNDNLDGAMIWHKLLVESGEIFGPLDSTVPTIMNGLPRNVLGSEFNPIIWMYTFFGMFPAYVLNFCLMHLVAFASMFLLLKRHFLPGKEHAFIVVGTALAFALLPFWPFAGLSIAGMPLLLYSYLNIRERRESKLDWLILLLVPFYSSLVYGSAFFLGGLVLFLLFDLVRGKRNYKCLLAIALMSLVFALVEWRLIFSMFFDSGFVSHRVEFLGYPNNFVMVLGRSARTFIFGDALALSLHHFFIFLAAAIAIALLFLKRKGVGFVQWFKASLLAKLVLLTVTISVFAEFVEGWDVLFSLRQKIALLAAFDFSRFTFLFPLLWYVAFALSLKTISGKLRLGRQIALILIVLQAGFLFCYSDWLVQGGGAGVLLSDGLSYNEFYSPALMQEIEDFIGMPQADYRVVSIGMQPAIAQYSGFYTLDSYQSNYPLEYKYKFRKIIEAELEKSPTHLKRYFDEWANRVYVFVAELPEPHFYTKDRDVKVSNLELNTVALKEMGGEYVFSSVEILNADETGLSLLKVFERADSPWKIWLYGVE